MHPLGLSWSQGIKKFLLSFLKKMKLSCKDTWWGKEDKNGLQQPRSNAVQRNRMLLLWFRKKGLSTPLLAFASWNRYSGLLIRVMLALLVSLLYSQHVYMLLLNFSTFCFLSHNCYPVTHNFHLFHGFSHLPLHSSSYRGTITESVNHHLIYMVFLVEFFRSVIAYPASHQSVDRYLKSRSPFWSNDLWPRLVGSHGVKCRCSSIRNSFQEGWDHDRTSEASQKDIL